MRKFTYPTVKTENGLRIETYPNGAVATQKRISNWWQEAQERTVQGIVTNTNFEYCGIPKLWQQGLSGNGVKVGCIGGALRLSEQNRYGFTLVDSFNYATQNSVETMTNDERHGYQCASVISGNIHDGNGIKGVAPNAQLYAANNNNLEASLMWMWSKGVRIVYIAYDMSISDGAIRMFKFYKQNGGIVIISGSQSSEQTQVSALCTKYTLNVGQFKGGGGYYQFDPSILNSILKKEDGSGIDIVAPGMGIYGIPSDYQVAGGSSYTAPMVAGVLALLKEKYPDKPMRQLAAMLIALCKEKTKSIPILGL